MKQKLSKKERSQFSKQFFVLIFIYMVTIYMVIILIYTFSKQFFVLYGARSRDYNFKSRKIDYNF